MLTTSSNLPYCLQWFLNGNTLCICIEICNRFGEFTYSTNETPNIKKGHIRDLHAKGYIKKDLIVQFGIAYWRYKVSKFALLNFEEYKNDCSK